MTEAKLCRPLNLTGLKTNPHHYRIAGILHPINNMPSIVVFQSIHPS